jgi:hypothetical protein
MDPNATLARMMFLVKTIQNAPGEDGDATAADELAELVDALNSWLCSGGFYPKAWERAR